MSEQTPFERVGGVIPYFFFDAIGRIVPGAFLIIGIAWVEWSEEFKFYVEKLRDPPQGLGISFVLLFFSLIAAYFAGLVLGAFSSLIEKAWERLGPWTLDDLRMRLGKCPDQESELEARFRANFRFAIETDYNRQRRVPDEAKQKVNEEVQRAQDDKRQRQWEQHVRIRDASELCSVFVAGISQRLAALGSRWDAEALATRSVLAASAVLLLWSLCSFQGLRGAGFGLAILAAFVLADILYEHKGTARVWKYRVRVLLVLPVAGLLLSFVLWTLSERWHAAMFLATTGGAYIAYKYHRRRKLEGRFDLFLIVSGLVERPTGDEGNTPRGPSGRTGSMFLDLFC